jgi:hypothetical protein
MIKRSKVGNHIAFNPGVNLAATIAATKAAERALMSAERRRIG